MSGEWATNISCKDSHSYNLEANKSFADKKYKAITTWCYNCLK